MQNELLELQQLAEQTALELEHARERSIEADALTIEVQALRSRLTDEEAKATKAGKRIAELEAETRTLEARNKTLDSKVESMLEQLAEEGEKARQLPFALKEAEMLRSALNEMNTWLLSAEDDARDRAVATRELELTKTLLEREKAATAEASTDIAALKEEVRDLQLQCARHKAASDELERACTQLSTDNAALADQCQREKDRAERETAAAADARVLVQEATEAVECQATATRDAKQKQQDTKVRSLAEREGMLERLLALALADREQRVKRALMWTWRRRA